MEDVLGWLNVIWIVLSFIALWFVIPLIQDVRVKYWVTWAVAGAEKLFGPKTGAQKREYVLTFLRSKFKKMPDGVLRMLLEAACTALENSAPIIISTVPEDPIS